ncbi:MAG: polysaccharide biosynthesis transport protein [Desulfobacteraceae bacterium Eth-SRB2]|nr:MAG: polysaccharide biosynthesis transport protein [Desulfobacteraceae bacterium Eth-SRB2]
MEEHKEKQIDLRQYLGVMIKRRWIIFTIFTVLVLTVAVNTFTAVPIYQATARIVIEKENPNLVSIQEVLAVDSTGTDYYQTQYKIIESRAVAREVIRRLDLNNSTEFFPQPKDTIISNIKGWIRDTLSNAKEWIKSLLKTEQDKDGANARAQDYDSPDSELVSAFIDRIDVSPIRNSRLVDVSAEAKNPTMAARMANELVMSYIDKNLEIKLLAAKDAVKWLGERVSDERKKVEAAEKALLRYKEENQIITGFSSDAENITAQKLAELNAQVVEAESKRVEAETRYHQALTLKNSPDMLDSIPEVLSNDLVKEVKKMEVVLYSRMSELSKKYGRNHPQMQAIESELADLKKRKAVEAKRVVNSLKNEYKLALAREESLKHALAKQKTESLQFNKKAVQFGVLQRETESSKHMYELLIKRFKETSLTEEMKTGNIRIIDKAEVPRLPVKPKKKLNLLLAVIVGLSLGVGLAFFLEYLDNTIKLPEEIKEELKIPYLGPVPAFSADGNPHTVPLDLVTIHSPKSNASESYRGIRTGILFSSADTTPQVIMVTSAGPKEGKTSSSTNLSVAMANVESRVLLVDCDMRRPRIHKLFDIDRKIGLSSILVGTENPENAIVASSIQGLDILPVGPIPPNPSEIISSKKMAQFLNDLRKKYSRVIIDTPPISGVTDAVALAQMVDTTLLVIRAGETPRQVIQNSLEQLYAVNANVLGAILNAVSVGRDSYYYYQYYYQYYGEDGDRKKRSQRKKRKTGRYSS